VRTRFVKYDSSLDPTSAPAVPEPDVDASKVDPRGTFRYHGGLPIPGGQSRVPGNLPHGQRVGMRPSKARGNR
jgi:hypothetical protein